MKEWFEKIKPPKYLRYLFFIAYSFYRRFSSERSNAHNTSILFLGAMHLLAYEGILLWTSMVKGRTSIFFVVIIVSIQLYIWFWYKEKWKCYVKEFEKISRKNQLLGGVYLLPIAIPVVLSLAYDINVYS